MWSIPHHVVESCVKYLETKKKVNHLARNRWHGMLRLLEKCSPAAVRKSRDVMAFLKEVTRNIILKDVLRSPGEKKAGEIHWKVLILDQFSSKIVSNCCGMHDITVEGITLVENLHKRREPLPFLDAVYMLRPNNEDSTTALINDLNATSNMYKAFHIFFIERCPEDVMKAVSESLQMLRVKTLREINLSYIPYQSHVFLTEPSPSRHRLYYNLSEDGGKVSENIHTMARQIATFCTSVGEFPSIRYRSSFPMNSDLTAALEEELRKACPSGEEQDQSKSQSQLIILDRAFDCVSVLLHELTYEAMIHDLLAVSNDEYKITTNTGGFKQIYLDSDDPYWNELKHLHIAEVLKKVPQDYRNLIQSKNENSKNASEVRVPDLQLMVKKLPQYQKELSAFTNHISLAKDCLEIYEKRIKRLYPVEQDLATGEEETGEKIKDIISKKIYPILMDNDEESVTNMEKLRLIILYIIGKKGMKSVDDLKRLFDHANLDQTYLNMVNNLAMMGQAIIAGPPRKDAQPILERKKRTDVPYKSRWVPVIKDIIEYAMEGRLDEKLFPFQTNRNPNVPYKSPSSARFVQHWYPKGNLSRTLPRIIIFVVGGVTYSEIRAMYEINRAQSDWEIVLGSTEVITPETFLQELDSLG